ncbi:MFS transporter [Phormidium tenue FACHB-886]|nr:MFS transporter [Phormidium tenue FACHB-886]
MRTLNQVGVAELQRPTLWLPLCALAAVYGMFTVSWMIYRVHLPGLLTQAGFAESLAPALLLIEAVIAIALEPLAGAFSDRTNRQQGSRFPLITLGVILSSLLFVAIPALMVFAPPTGSAVWTLPTLLISWAIGMSLFRSPALALLRRYAPNLQLPQAASVLTFAAGIAGAAAPLASKSVLDMGTTAAFTLGAVLILLSVMWLRWMNPIGLVASEPAEYFNSAKPISLISLGAIFGLGLSATLALRLVTETLPKILKAQVPDITPPTFIGVLFIALAVAAFPVGKFATRNGNSKTMLIGVGLAALFISIMSFTQTAGIALIMALGLGVAFSFLTNGTLPFALSLVPPDRAGLGVGMFFAGAAAATSLFTGILAKPGVLAPTAGVAIGIMALVAAALCVLAGEEQSKA